MNQVETSKRYTKGSLIFTAGNPSKPNFQGIHVDI